MDEISEIIELVRGDHSEDTEIPFITKFSEISDKMKFNPDREIVKEIGTSLLKDPHCPCSISKSDNMLCPCLPCRTKNICHCGMFVKIN